MTYVFVLMIGIRPPTPAYAVTGLTKVECETKIAELRLATFDNRAAYCVPEIKK